MCSLFALSFGSNLHSFVGTVWKLLLGALAFSESEHKI